MNPVSDEVAGALGAFFFAGGGPSHGKLGSTFASSGYGDSDPYDGSQPNKETRVLLVVRAAVRRPVRARELVDGILTQLRLGGCFDPGSGSYDKSKVVTAQRAFHRLGWLLADDGYLTPAGLGDLTTGGRKALDDHLDRLRRASDDPALLLGTAKDLLESVAKFVLEELELPYSERADFAELWFHARDRLGIHPRSIAATNPASKQIAAVLQAAWSIAEAVNQIRNQQGTGHGRTLPTGMTVEMALLMVREAASVAEFVLTTLDRTLGRRAE